MNSESSGSEAEATIDIVGANQIGSATLPFSDDSDTVGLSVLLLSSPSDRDVKLQPTLEVPGKLNNPLVRRRASLPDIVDPINSPKRPRQDQTIPRSPKKTTDIQAEASASCVSPASLDTFEPPSLDTPATNGEDPKTPPFAIPSVGESYLRTPEALVFGHSITRPPLERLFIASAQKAIGEFDIERIKEMRYFESIEKNRDEVEKLILQGNNDDLGRQLGLLRAELDGERKGRVEDARQAETERKSCWARDQKALKFKLEQASKVRTQLQKAHESEAEAWARDKEKLEEGIASWKRWSEKKEETPRLSKEDMEDLFGSDDEAAEPAADPVKAEKLRLSPRTDTPFVPTEPTTIVPPLRSGPAVAALKPQHRGPVPATFRSVRPRPIAASLSWPSGSVTPVGVSPGSFRTSEQETRKKYDRLKQEYAKERDAHAKERDVKADLAKRHYNLTLEVRQHQVRLNQLRERIEQCGYCHDQEATLPDYPVKRSKACGRVTFAVETSATVNTNLIDQANSTHLPAVEGDATRRNHMKIDMEIGEWPSHLEREKKEDTALPPQTSAILNQLEAELIFLRSANQRGKEFEQQVTKLQTVNAEWERLAGEREASVDQQKGIVTALTAEIATLQRSNDVARDGHKVELQRLQEADSGSRSQIQQHETAISQQEATNQAHTGEISTRDGIITALDAEIERLREELAGARRSSGGYRVLKEGGRDVYLIDDDD